MDEFWLIEESYLRPYLEKVYNASQEDIEKAIEKAGDSFDDLMKDPVIFSTEGDRAIIKVSGVLTMDKPSFFARLFGLAGTQYQQIIDAIAKAEADPMIKSIDVLADTPGGTVKGADITNRAFFNAKKPIRTINMGMLASAGIYIAAPSNKILALEPNSLTGSIGIIASIRKGDTGIIELVSSNAKNKNPDPTTKAGKSVFQERINAMENNFIARVAEGRGVSTEKVKSDFGQGGMLIAQNPDGNDAIKAGMIDGMLSDDVEMIEGNDDFSAQENSESTSIIEDENINTSLTGKEIYTVNEFEKFLSENPGAMAIYQKNLDTAKAEGRKDAETAQAAVVAKVSPILKSDSYDSAMKEQAVKALAGDMDLSAFTALVGMEDMRIERSKESTAKEETEKTPDTKGDPEAKEGKTGQLETSEDVKATADLMQEVI